MIGKLIASGVEGIGNAVSDVVGTIWGDKAEPESAIHHEQLAVLAQFAAEFAGRPRLHCHSGRCSRLQSQLAGTRQPCMGNGCAIKSAGQRCHHRLTSN